MEKGARGLRWRSGSSSKEKRDRRQSKDEEGLIETLSSSFTFSTRICARFQRPSPGAQGTCREASSWSGKEQATFFLPRRSLENNTFFFLRRLFSFVASPKANSIHFRRPTPKRRQKRKKAKEEEKKEKTRHFSIFLCPFLSLREARASAHARGARESALCGV